MGGNSSIIVSGGSVINRFYSCAILSGEQNDEIFVKGGFVFACGIAPRGFEVNNTICLIRGPLNSNFGGEGVICAWDSMAGNTEYTLGSSKDFAIGPVGASAAWAINGTKHGIKYVNGANSGFLEIKGVTVSDKTEYNEVAFHL